MSLCSGITKRRREKSKNTDTECWTTLDKEKQYALVRSRLSQREKTVRKWPIVFFSAFPSRPDKIAVFLQEVRKKNATEIHAGSEIRKYTYIYVSRCVCIYGYE